MLLQELFLLLQWPIICKEVAIPYTPDLTTSTWAVNAKSLPKSQSPSEESLMDLNLSTKLPISSPQWRKINAIPFAEAVK